ncbi:MAG TPA: DUF3551 domain-containing protein [Xanthobacteraceae bacterium]|nr:DUF3551 domain-containing protein [Xanthobacteraceae bacterium]
MRRLAFCSLFAAVALAAGAPGSGEAQARKEYPWCAMIPVFQGGASALCAFDTLERCLEEVRGMGGWCSVNPYSAGPAARQAPPPRRVRPQPRG